jgi:hypothetical protein
MNIDPLARSRPLASERDALAPTRFAFPLKARYISMMLPAAKPGSYLLLESSQPVYVGRSDRCVRQRLLSHPLRGKATHFTATITDDARGAYLLECYWFHRYRSDGAGLRNQIHPPGWQPNAQCPFCSPVNFDIAA